MHAAPKSSGKANVSSWSFQQWQYRWHDCDRLSKSYRLLRGVVKAPTPFSESNTNDERLWFRTQLPKQWRECIDATASDWWPSTPYSHHTPRSFSPGTRSYAFEVYKTCIDIFGILPRFLQKLLESGKLVCSATSRTKSALRILQLCKAFGTHVSREAKERDSPVVDALWVWSPHFSNLSFLLPERHATWHTRGSQRTRFKALNISGRISSQPAAFPPSVFWQQGRIRL